MHWVPQIPVRLAIISCTRVEGMEYRRLGRSGMYVSAIAYGNWITHGNQIESDSAKACVSAALDVGITTFDTADVYADTAAEVVLAEALKGIRRESYELFTKVYWPVGEGKNDRGLSRKHIMEACNASLRRLQTDHIDLYQAHRYDFETPLEETLRAFDDLVRAGKVNYIGVSEWTASQIADALEISDAMGFDRIVSSQPQYSMLWRVIEEEVVPLCETEGIGQIVWSPLGQGVLTGKYLPGQPLPAGSRAAADKDVASIGDRLMNDKVLTAVQGLKPIAESIGLTMSQLALAWVLQNENVSAAIIGATRPEQVRENVKAAGIKLEASVMKAIDAALGSIPVTDPSKTESPNPRA